MVGRLASTHESHEPLANPIASKLSQTDWVRSRSHAVACVMSWWRCVLIFSAQVVGGSELLQLLQRLLQLLQRLCGRTGAVAQTTCLI